MAKTFEFDTNAQKESLISLYGGRRQEVCLNLAANIEFLERRLAVMKNKALAGKVAEPDEYVDDLDGELHYVCDKVQDISNNIAEIEKCTAVLGALRQV